MIRRIPTRLDRYPAKMVSRLAERLVTSYASDATRLLDPFCGSGAIMAAAARKGIMASGIDINPVAALLCNVKMQGFQSDLAIKLLNDVITYAKETPSPLPIIWENKGYWFTDGTLDKYERLRAAAVAMRLAESPEGRVVLLGLTLSVRLCSRADQRSPKPFISKRAIQSRSRRHFDPYCITSSLLSELSCLYSQRLATNGFSFCLGDVANDCHIPEKIGMHSHVITSPPYVNAQDYYRNFKLELAILDGIIPFISSNLRECFIGTERGDLLAGIPAHSINALRSRVPKLPMIEAHSARLGAVVLRYCHDMERGFDTIKACLEPHGVLVLVCGDNLIAGVRFPTWQMLRDMLMERGFNLIDSFSDVIRDRVLPPKRCGHKGLIKKEVVSVFRLC